MTLGAAFGGQPATAEAPRHPLDPLMAAEYQAAVAPLRRANRANEDSRYPMIMPQNPPKAEVWTWQPGQPLRRAALLVVKQRAQTFEAVVDLTDDRAVAWREVKGVQPGLLLEER
jgi:primary-amine oxidase